MEKKENEKQNRKIRTANERGKVMTPFYDTGVFGMSSHGGEINSRESFSVTGPQQIQ